MWITQSAIKIITCDVRFNRQNPSSIQATEESRIWISLSFRTWSGISYFFAFRMHSDKGIKNETLNKDTSGWQERRSFWWSVATEESRFFVVILNLLQDLVFYLRPTWRNTCQGKERAKYAQGDRKVVIPNLFRNLVFSIGVSREMCSLDLKTLS